jgi:hypothetical protein
MSVIDADAHVVETERTWEYMEEAESPFKPEVVVPKAGGDREYWLIEGRAFAKNTNIGKDTPDEAREVSDIATRLVHMDELGVDVCGGREYRHWHRLRAQRYLFGAGGPEEAQGGRENRPGHGGQILG